MEAERVSTVRGRCFKRRPSDSGLFETPRSNPDLHYADLLLEIAATGLATPGLEVRDLEGSYRSVPPVVGVPLSTRTVFGVIAC